MKNRAHVSIELCLGSACFARGNKDVITVLKNFIGENNLSDEIDIRGALCQGQCKDGPVVIVNGKPYNRLTPEALMEIVRGTIGGEKL